MIDWISKLFDTSDFPARWHCGNWSPWLGWVHIVSDLLIFLCYVMIPILLVRFKRRRRDVPFPQVFSLFAVFILSCGFVHLIEAIIFWEPIYRFSGVVKMITGGASVATVSYMVPTIPKVFALRSPQALETEIRQRVEAEEQLRALQRELEEQVRERTKEVLAEQARLRLALFAGQMGIWELDFENDRIRFDEAALRVLGVSEQAPNLSKLLERVHPNDRNKLRETLDQIRAGNEKRTAVAFRIAIEGVGFHPVETRFAAHRPDAPAGVLAVSWDVTELFQTKEQNRRLQELLEATPDFVSTADLEGHITWWNAAFREWFGGAEEEVSELRLSSLYPTETAQLMQDRAVPQALRDGSWVGETVVQAGDKRRDVSQLIVAHRDAHGEVTHTTTLMRDLSDLKAREALLRESEERLRAAVEAAPNAMAMVDRVGAITMYNAEFMRLFGYDAAELQALNVDTLVPAAARREHAVKRAHFLKHPIRRPMGADQMLYGRHKDGHSVPLEIGLNPLEIRGETFTLVAIVDISERLKAREAIEAREASLQRSNEELTEFVYAASHDLQEPLRKVTSFCQLLERHAGDSLDDTSRQFVSYAVDGAQRMQKLITDLLEYSRVAQAPLDTLGVSCQQVVEEVIQELAELQEQYQAEITVGELPYVEAREHLVHQVFMNLIGNALKYRHPDRPPKIGIRAEQHRGFWHFSVSDNGIGIPPTQHSRVFRVFQRLHRKEEVPGTGIGLAIVKKAVERSGGTVWLDSAENQGTTVHFTLRAELDPDSRRFLQEQGEGTTTRTGKFPAQFPQS